MATAPSGSDIAAQNFDMARFIDRLVPGLHDELRAVVDAADAFQVLSQRFAGHGRAVAVQHSQVEQSFQDGGRAADFVQIEHHIASAGFQVGEVRHFVADAVEVIERPFHFGLAGNRHQVQHGIGRAAERENERVRVFQGLAGDQVARPDVVLDETDKGFARQKRLALFGGGHAGTARAVGQGKPHRLDRAAHGVGRVHAAARARAGTRAALHLMHFLLTDMSGLILPDGLEDAGDIYVLPRLIDARQNAAAIYENAGDVQASHRHHAAGHVLVAAAEREYAVVVHASRHDLDAVGNHFAGDQAVAHPLMPHHDAVAGRGRAEDLRHAAACPHALAAVLYQPVEMRVAGRDGAEQACHADHRAFEILVMKSDCPQHGAVGGAADAVCRQATDAV